MALIEIRSLSKTFKAGRKALDDVSITLQPGEMVALIGASGSGKSTLLRHIAGFTASDAHPESLIRVGDDIVQRGGRLARDVRRVRAGIGFVFQQFNLVGRLTVLTNVLTGQLYRVPTHRSLFKLFSAEERRAGIAALAEVGIDDYAYQRASTLSGGQQQRAAIARALVQGAKVLLADEPIASLDPESSRKVMEILSRVNRDHGCAVLVSLHQVDVAIKYCPRVIAMRHGKVVFDGPATHLTPSFLNELYGAEAQELLAPQAPLATPDYPDASALPAAA